MSEPDEARDAHLRAALRHAPDAQLQAPPQLSERILKEARAKARDPMPVATPAPSWARRAWDWLARPAVATGFAGVMAATLVGLMWWDQPMDEAIPRSPAPTAAPIAARPPVAPMPDVSGVERSPPTPQVTTSRPKPEPVRKKSEGAPRHTATESATVGAARSAPPTTPPEVPAPTPAPAAPPLSFPTDATRESLAKARVTEEETKREHSSMAPAEPLSRRSAAKVQLNESRLQAEGEAYTRVASVRAAIAAEPARWTWQLDNSDARPLNDALDAWLAQLDAATTTRWQSVEAVAQRSGRELRLRLDGHVQHSFRITNSGILWQRRQGIWMFSPLATTNLTALEASLP